jgi:high-affinity K+ transport system ATPase subunit B
MWLTCIQNAPGTNSGDQMVQMVEAVQRQEVLQQVKLQVNLVGRSVVRAGERERFLVHLSERGCPK